MSLVLCISCGKRGAQGNSVHTNDTVCTNSGAQGSSRDECIVRSNDTICIDDSVRIYDMALEKVMYNDDVSMKPDTRFVFYVTIENLTSHVIVPHDCNHDDAQFFSQDTTYKRCSYIIYNYKDKHGKAVRRNRMWIWPDTTYRFYLLPYSKEVNYQNKLLYSAGMGEAPEGSVSIDVELYLNLFYPYVLLPDSVTPWKVPPLFSRKIEHTFRLK